MSAGVEYKLLPTEPPLSDARTAVTLAGTPQDTDADSRDDIRRVEWQVPEPPLAAWPLHPSCMFFKVWNPLMLSTVCADVFLQPLTCVFVFESDEARLLKMMLRMSDYLWTMFIIDSALQFICQAHRLDGCGMEKSLSGIAIMNLWSRQFAYDVLSIMPWTCLYEALAPRRIEPGQGMRSALVITFLFMRLFRFCRLSTIPRLFHIWRNKIHISFVVRTVSELAFAFFLLVHCLACFWSVIGLANPMGTDTWLTLYWHGDPPTQCWSIYVASMYWAVATVTSIGYGDLVPQSANVVEVGVAVWLIITAASGWSVVIANAVKLVNDVHEDTEEYRKTLDTCESLFKSQPDIDRTLRHQIREYFLKFFDLKKTQNSRVLMRKMSPHLQRTVVKKVYRNWIEDVPWIERMSESCLVSLVFKMEQLIYIPREYIPDSRITSFVELGAVFIGGRVLRKGDSWGIDMTINGSTRKRESGWALNFVSTLSLSRRHLDDVLEDFPDDNWKVKRISSWMALRRKVKELARVEKKRRAAGEAPQRGFFEKIMKAETEDHEYVALSDDSRFMLKNMRKDFKAVQDKQEAAEQQAVHSREQMMGKLCAIESTFSTLSSQVHCLAAQQSSQQTLIEEMTRSIHSLNSPDNKSRRRSMSGLLS